ncbi:AAA family ATPase [Sporichthya polymorpha]|uniref:AAA family ATPase n=1 Tax=Sporichthya polymorpha TaxID=35751 RepID=UPI0012EB6B28|nr:AAA family ATPase [Sporichthya polymorpha]
MAEWPLVGRDREMAFIRARVEDPTSRGVVLAASAGVGKSRLAAELRRSVAHAGIPTLVATGTTGAAHVPLGAMTSALSALGTMPLRGNDPFTLLQDVVQHVIDQAGSERIFVVVDDAHLLDNASALLLQQLAQSAATFLVVTIRNRVPAPDAVTALWKDGLLDRVDLTELAEPAIEQLLGSVLGGPIDGAALAALTARSQGNLLYLRELVEAARMDGTLRFEHDLWRMVGLSRPSARLAELVQARLGRLTAAERWLLDLLAVGEPLGTRELDLLSSFAVAERLEDVGLIASRDHGRRLELRLSHPLYGEVLSAQMSEEQEQRLCRSLAQAVESTGLRRHDDILRVAMWRLRAGGASPDHLLTAATAARWRLDLDVAHRLASAAVEAGAGFEAELMTAQLLLRLGKPDEADLLFARLCTDEDQANRVRATLARVDIAQGRGRPEEMRRLLRSLGSDLRDPGLRAAVAARACTAALILEGPRAALDLPVPSFGTADAAAAYPFFESRAIAHSRAGQHRLAEQDLARRDVDGSDEARLGWWQIPTSTATNQHLVYTGRLLESIDGLQEQYRRAAEIGSSEMQMAFASALGRRQMQAGRLSSALKLVHEAEALAAELSYDLVGQESARMIALIEAMLGRPAAARRALDSIAGAVTHAFSEGLAGEARAWLAVAEGETEQGARILRETADRCRAIGDHVHEASALHALVRIGHAADAAAALEGLRTEIDGVWVGLYADHARGVVDGDPDLLERTAREFEGLGAMLLGAETAADARAAWQAAGDARRETAARNYALGLAEHCEGARTPALSGLGRREPLTGAELLTAWAAARGESNKSIAARLQLSVRTVETRLQGVYLKLGVSGRKDLAAALPEEAAAGPGTLAP